MVEIVSFGIEFGIKGSKRCDVHLSSQKVRDNISSNRNCVAFWDFG